MQLDTTKLMLRTRKKEVLMNSEICRRICQLFARKRCNANEAVVEVSCVTLLVGTDRCVELRNIHVCVLGGGSRRGSLFKVHRKCVVLHISLHDILSCT